ncbi:MAG: Fic family protein [Phycisphaeraceae bacterium]|nr:Fic family protein [Phycisphaerae bacterium]MBX3391269.1 Fic family protein [Phycisphaeraceae bacterium]
MAWNWQRADWPHFTWERSRLAKAEERFLLGGGVFLGTVKHLNSENRHQLTVEAMSNEAVTTSEIEGEILDRDSVQSSIRRQLGLATDHRRVQPAEQGIGEMMVDLFRNYAKPLDDDTLFAWHRMIANGRTDLRDIGRYRTHPEPMQVVSGRIYDPKVHFEAPPSARVGIEMRRYIEWFNRTAPTGPEPLPVLARAGIAHLYFECIHPFEDGNGRVGRAIAEKVLAQSLGQPTLTAIAATILANRKGYYDALEAANKGTDLTDWLAWFAGIGLEAQQRTLVQVEFLIDKTKLLDKFRGTLNERQQKVLIRMLNEGPEGFKGGLSAKNYVAIAKTSTATASRDLADMAERGVLIRTGEKRGARYHLSIPLRQVPRITIDKSGEIVKAPRPQG